MGSEFKKVTTLVTTQLKQVEKRMWKADQHDWNKFKHTPQILKQKIKYAGGSYTVDQEFNDLEQAVIDMDIQVKKMLKYIKVFAEGMPQILSSSTKIAEAFQNLMDPYSNLKYDTHVLQGAFDTWTRITNYKHKIKDVHVDIEVNDLTDTVIKKLEDLSAILKSVFKKTSIRQGALLDYDKVYNDHEALVLKQEQTELTLAQNNNLFALKRKLDEYKVKYDKLNTILKKELPIFIEYGREVIDMIQVYVYFAHLTFCYQIAIQLQVRFPVEKDVNAIINEFTKKNEPIAEEIESLSLICTQLPHGGASQPSLPKPTHCVAMYDFDGKEDSDLPIKKGDVIALLDTDGDWWKGQVHGKIGYFPSSYVKIE
ncbi:LAS seventeen-binding protein 3 [Candida viswanathii]|uniref:LAS seventeen-binding protein 3 n=1 Tax=Candida viswanathii TaxID=5486 RepID=A0A367Y4U0_9ASCO|nr:LAS seventeen-binding protein 3 [Candida viswanathii]